MTQRQKLELSINTPTEIELLFDEPISGKSQYGPYHMYAVKAGDEEFTFFPGEEVHEQLKNLKKGDKAVITKLAAQRGSKVVTSYEVKITSLPKSTLVDDSEPSPATDNFYEIMLGSYRDALNIQKELNGMADPERIAITLFIARSKTTSY